MSFNQDFKVFGYTSTGLKTIANNETNISYFYDLSQNSKLSYGAFYDNILNQSLYLRISPNNNYNFNNSKLTVLAVKCLNNDCGPTSPTILQNENYLLTAFDIQLPLFCLLNQKFSLKFS